MILQRRAMRWALGWLFAGAMLLLGLLLLNTDLNADIITFPAGALPRCPGGGGFRAVERASQYPAALSTTLRRGWPAR